MARMSVQLPEEFMNRISSLAEKTDEIVPKVLEAGGAVVLDAVRSNLAAVVGKGTKYKSRSTGELIGALGLSPAKLDSAGNFNVKIGFAEPHSGGISNAMLGNILEYGKVGQPPKPFLKPAKSASKKACVAAMVDAFEQIVGDI